MPPATERLRLRNWIEADTEPFATMSADPEVMEFFPSILERAEAEVFATRVRAKIDERGWGLWAVERQSDRRFIGFVGLQPVREQMPFAPAIEVGWRLAREFWGNGYATEAATACLEFAFGQLGFDEIVSFTTQANWRSIAVMRRIGLADRGQDFEHPILPRGHRLRPHVLYGTTADEWVGSQ